MKEDEEECDGMERDKEGRPHTGEELGVGFGALREGPELPEVDPGKERHEDACELSQHEPRVAAVLEPPPDRHAASVPPGMVQGVARLGPHLAPRGSIKDLNQSATPVSLYCWMAPAGSTFFGHTFVHSPTKVHSQIPSLPERSSRRSAAPWSRESML